jgi:hypothetical protein
LNFLANLMRNTVEVFGYNISQCNQATVRRHGKVFPRSVSAKASLGQVDANASSGDAI